MEWLPWIVLARVEAEYRTARPNTGRQGKRLDGRWSDVSEEIGILGLLLDTPCWRFRPNAQ